MRKNTGPSKPIPFPADPSAAPSVQIETTKPCPHCAESLAADATVCEHCGKDLPPPDLWKGYDF